MSIQLQNAVCRPSASTSCLSANSYRCTILARQPRCRLRARRQGPQTARRARLAIAAAAPENSGGWLSQWFQGLVQGTISRSDQPRKMAQEVPQRPESSDTAAARMPSSDAGKPGAAEDHAARAAGASALQPDAQPASTAHSEPATTASSAPAGVKAAGFRAAKARAVGTGGSSGGTTAREAEVARLTAAAATPPLQSAGGRSGQADPALGGWDGGRLPGEQSWDENVPDGKLLGKVVTVAAVLFIGGVSFTLARSAGREHTRRAAIRESQRPQEAAEAARFPGAAKAAGQREDKHHKATAADDWEAEMEQRWAKRSSWTGSGFAKGDDSDNGGDGPVMDKHTAAQQGAAAAGAEAQSAESDADADVVDDAAHDRAVKAGAASAIHQQAEAQDAEAVAPLPDHDPLPASAHSQQWRSEVAGAENGKVGGQSQKQNSSGREAGRQAGGGGSRAQAAPAEGSKTSGWSAETAQQAAQLRRQEARIPGSGNGQANDSASASGVQQGPAASAETTARAAAALGTASAREARGDGPGTANDSTDGSGRRTGSGGGAQAGTDANSGDDSRHGNGSGGSATDAARTAAAQDGRGSAASAAPEATGAASSSQRVSTDAARLAAARDSRGSAAVAEATSERSCGSGQRRPGQNMQSIHFEDEPEEPHETLCLPPPAEPVAQQPAPQHFSKEWSVSALKQRAEAASRSSTAAADAALRAASYSTASTSAAARAAGAAERAAAAASKAAQALQQESVSHIRQSAALVAEAEARAAAALSTARDCEAKAAQAAAMSTAHEDVACAHAAAACDAADISPEDAAAADPQRKGQPRQSFPGSQQLQRLAHQRRRLGAAAAEQAAPLRAGMQGLGSRVQTASYAVGNAAAKLATILSAWFAVAWAWILLAYSHISAAARRAYLWASRPFTMGGGGGASAASGN